MKTFKVYTARLVCHNHNEFLGNIIANSLEEAKQKAKTLFNKNPFYCVFQLDDEIVYNEHLALSLKS